MFMGVYGFLIVSRIEGDEKRKVIAMVFLSFIIRLGSEQFSKWD